MVTAAFSSCTLPSSPWPSSSSIIESTRIIPTRRRHDGSRRPILQKVNTRGERNNNNRLPLSLSATAAGTTRDRSDDDEDKDKTKHSHDNHHHDHDHPSSTSSLLRHVAIICDGNARWAQQRGLPTQIGHMKGAERLVQLIEHLANRNNRGKADPTTDEAAAVVERTVRQAQAAVQVEHCTLYGFSTENWSRPQREIDGIFKVMEFTADRMLGGGGGDRRIGKMSSSSSWLKSNNIRLQIIGNWNNDERIPERLRRKFQRLIDESSSSSNHHEQQQSQQQQRCCLTVHLAINYGGRSDIVEATKQIVADSLSRRRSVGGSELDCINNRSVVVDDIDESFVRKYLSTSSSSSSSGHNNIPPPDPDMIIRTGGEYRLSNFLLFESAYSELYFTETLWPDFDLQSWEEAVSWFQTRQRRFGSRNENEETTTATTTTTAKRATKQQQDQTKKKGTGKTTNDSSFLRSN